MLNTTIASRPAQRQHADVNSISRSTALTIGNPRHRRFLIIEKSCGKRGAADVADEGVWWLKMVELNLAGPPLRRAHCSPTTAIARLEVYSKMPSKSERRVDNELSHAMPFHADNDGYSMNEIEMNQ